jgi:chemotaxis protein MotB
MMLGSIGCVSQKHADDMQTMYRRSQEQIIDLKAQLEECNKRVAAMSSVPAPTPQMVQDPNLLAQLSSLRSERDRLNQALIEAKQALIAASQTAVLPLEIDNDLEQLAQSNSAMMQYDKKMGMIKFSSDLTFASGSTDISAGAQSGLAQLAAVMRKPIAQKYELRIVGHTDNVRIGKPATRAAHPTNWHLSVHRAIAVKDILAKAGVDQYRMQVAGDGEFRPVAPNVPRKGNAANRRVEIYIVPLNYTPIENTVSEDQAMPSSEPGASAGTTHVVPNPTSPEAFK